MERTICAISTGLTASGIIIVRMTGPEAVSVARKVFKGADLNLVHTHTIHHGYIVFEGKTVDEVLVSVMRAPHTYTGEDTVEINCHGGVLVAEKVLEILLKSGAKAAEPGEFTKRAFLNGRMDLSQAEAVIDVIHAENDFALQASVSQLKGAVSEKIRVLRESILNEVAFIEAALDDPEHYSLDGYESELTGRLQKMRDALAALEKRSDEGAKLTQGIRTVIAGCPNAGKSSLLNLLSGYEKAIVTDVAGTTRDILEVPVTFYGLSLILMDTAGLRDTEDVVEKIGVDRARNALLSADLVLYVVDSTVGLSEEDRRVLETLDPEKVLVIWNKVDLSSAFLADEVRTYRKIPFSAKTEKGFDELGKMIRGMFDYESIRENNEVMITNARERELIREAAQAMENAAEGAESGVSEEFLTVDLMAAYSSLGKIIGEEVTDDVIDRIFEKFCMGK